MKKINKILIISGPTASGKSELAKIIAAKTGGVIINADSVQLYKELPILSSQPNSSDLKAAEHFLYSILNYNQKSSVAAWLDLAKNIIDKNKELSKLPIIVGGTGLYISKLISGLNIIPEIDPKIRMEVRDLYDQIDKMKFIKILTDLGEEEEKIKNLDKQRLIRHLEVVQQTSKTLDWWQKQPCKNFYDEKDFIHINLEPERENLYQNCNLRFKLMMKNGAIDEVKKFLELSPKPDLPITKTIGYFEISDYLQNLIGINEAIEKASQKTRNYAKRQLTWFRNQFQNKIIIADPKNSAEKILSLLNQ